MDILIYPSFIHHNRFYNKPWTKRQASKSIIPLSKRTKDYF